MRQISCRDLCMLILVFVLGNLVTACTVRFESYGRPPGIKARIIESVEENAGNAAKVLVLVEGEDREFRDNGFNDVEINRLYTFYNWLYRAFLTMPEGMSVVSERLVAREVESRNIRNVRVAYVGTGRRRIKSIVFSGGALSDVFNIAESIGATHIIAARYIDSFSDTYQNEAARQANSRLRSANKNGLKYGFTSAKLVVDVSVYEVARRQALFESRVSTSDQSIVARPNYFLHSSNIRMNLVDFVLNGIKSNSKSG